MFCVEIKIECLCLCCAATISGNNMEPGAECGGSSDTSQAFPANSELRPEKSGIGPEAE